MRRAAHSAWPCAHRHGFTCTRPLRLQRTKTILATAHPETALPRLDSLAVRREWIATCQRVAGTRCRSAVIQIGRFGEVPFAMSDLRHQPGHTGTTRAHSRANRAGNLGGAGFVEVADDHLRALVGEGAADRCPDAACGAGDQRDLVLQAGHPRSPGRGGRRRGHGTAPAGSHSSASASAASVTGSASASVGAGRHSRGVLPFSSMAPTGRPRCDIT